MKAIKIILTLMIMVVMVAMCGVQEKAFLNEAVSLNALNDAAEAISMDDLIDMEASQGGLEPSGLGPMLVSPSTLPDGAVLYLLNPNRLRARPELLRAIRAPLSTMVYFYLNPPPDGCPRVIKGACPELPGNPKGSCTIEFDFTESCNASAETIIFGIPVTLSFVGKLSGSIDASSGLPILIATATDLKITSDKGNYLIYNGSVKKEFTEVSLAGAKWVLSTSDLNVKDSAGAIGTASGTRTVEVTYGTYYHAVNVGTLTYTPPDGSRTITIDVDIERTVNRDGLTKVVEIDDTVVTDGIARTLVGTLTWTGEERGESGELGSVTLNGTLTRTGPRGSVDIIFRDVEFRLNCNHNPWGGEIEVTNGEKSFIISFREDCGCIVDITRPDGSTVEHNTCNDTLPETE